MIWSLLEPPGLLESLGASQMPSQFPPYPRCVADASPRFHLSNEIWWKKYMKNELQNIANLGRKWDAKLVQKLRIMWIMPSIKGGNHRFRQHASKNNEKSWNTDPKKLDFHVPSRAKTQLALFQIYWKCYQLGTQMGFKLVQVGAFETRKLAKVRLQKHDKKKRSNKTLKFVQKWSKKRVPKKWSFWVFSGFHPSMVSRVSLGRLAGSKAHQNGGPDTHFVWF